MHGICGGMFRNLPLLKSTRYRFVLILKKPSTRADYRNLVDKHTQEFDSIHNNRLFLAWHRWYLLQMENILRHVDPTVALPYWERSLWSGAPCLDQVTSSLSPFAVSILFLAIIAMQYGLHEIGLNYGVTDKL